MEIDIIKPLKTYLKVDGRWFRFEYEGLNMICFNYGKFGHRQEGSIEPKAPNRPMNTQSTETALAVFVKLTSNETAPPEFGPWGQVLYLISFFLSL